MISQYYLFFKRIMDIAVAFLLLIALLPIIFLTAIVIKIDSPQNPVIYLSKRAAKDSGFFYMYKFRTMVIDAEHHGFSTANNDSRLTRIGGFLRRYKIDELPQLLNVIKGEMSLVGPRAQVLFYTDQYTDAEKEILKVKPGITDIATLIFINMDNTLGEENVDYIYANKIEPIKNKLRIQYVRDLSFKTDFLILFGTFIKLLNIKAFSIEKYLGCDAVLDEINNNLQ